LIALSVSQPVCLSRSPSLSDCIVLVKCCHNNDRPVTSLLSSPECASCWPPGHKLPRPTTVFFLPRWSDIHHPSAELSVGRSRDCTRRLRVIVGGRPHARTGPDAYLCAAYNSGSGSLAYMACRPPTTISNIRSGIGWRMWQRFSAHLNGTTKTLKPTRLTYELNHGG